MDEVRYQEIRVYVVVFSALALFALLMFSIQFSKDDPNA